MALLIEKLQNVLRFGNCTSEHFRGNGLGKIGTTGFVLGMVGGLHLGIYMTIKLLQLTIGDSMNSSFIGTLQMWSLYMGMLCIFHFMEFLTTAVNQPDSLSYESYIVNHSKSYTIAALLSWTEFWLEYLLLRPWKLRLWYVSALGFALVLMGQVVRSVAMWHCGEHFSHVIMHEHTQQHRLVTSGIYRYLRHPSYFGWFYWSVGTQLLLVNPLCALAYTAAAWSFFAGRIPYEEQLLVSFYGQQYVRYARGVPIGIPLVSCHVPVTWERTGAAVGVTGSSSSITSSSGSSATGSTNHHSGNKETTGHTKHAKKAH